VVAAMDAAQSRGDPDAKIETAKSTTLK
jgi:hypothetical protein